MWKTRAIILIVTNSFEIMCKFQYWQNLKNNKILMEVYVICVFHTWFGKSSMFSTEWPLGRVRLTLMQNFQNTLLLCFWFTHNITYCSKSSPHSILFQWLLTEKNLSILTSSFKYRSRKYHSLSSESNNLVEIAFYNSEHNIILQSFPLCCPLWQITKLLGIYGFCSTKSQ